MASGNKSFGKRIKKLRESKGYTQEQLAEIVGLEYQTISRIETGMYFTSYDTLTKMSEAFSVPIRDLFDYVEVSSREELVKNIKSALDTCNDEELEFVYSFLMNLKKFNS